MDIRISVSVRCRVIIDNKYVLIVSLNDFRRGKRCLAPIGGGIKTTDAGKRYLVERLDVNPTTFEKGNDLRFWLPKERLNQFRQWLRQTTELESNPAAREFYDETVVGRPIFSTATAREVAFTPGPLHEGPMRLWRHIEGQSHTELVDTHGFEQIYTTLLSPRAKIELLQATQQPNPYVELVTAKNIRQGQSPMSKISDWTKFLLV